MILSLDSCFEQSFPVTLGQGRIQIERAWNGERVFLYISWNNEDDEQIASTKIQFYPYQKLVWIGSIHVHPHHRENGLGVQIVDAIEAQSKREKVETIRLFTRRSAYGFWEKLGYHPEEDSRYLRKNLRTSTDIL
ncbi:MAG: GNAT family N-acetyltransferase [Verrucomicrobiales bacterium]|nr:GNAT family N-acetyltransferase [Verrucomicrobiales bacterium]